MKHTDSEQNFPSHYTRKLNLHAQGALVELKKSLLLFYFRRLFLAKSDKLLDNTRLETCRFTFNVDVFYVIGQSLPLFLQPFNTFNDRPKPIRGNTAYLGVRVGGLPSTASSSVVDGVEGHVRHGSLNLDVGDVQQGESECMLGLTGLQHPPFLQLTSGGDLQILGSPTQRIWHTSAAYYARRPPTESTLSWDMYSP